VDSPYYYYVYNPSTSSSQFSKTYEEHQQWVAQIRGNNG
jgi:cell division protein YceG involved in septum cleavage